MSVADGTSSRVRANEALEDLESRILALFANRTKLEVRDVRKKLAPKLRPEDHAMVSFAIHDLLIGQKLVMTSSRKLGKPLP
jgi:hypothetical protein